MRPDESSVTLPRYGLQGHCQLEEVTKIRFQPSSPPKKIFLGFMSLRGDLSQEADDPLQGKAIVDSLPMD